MARALDSTEEVKQRPEKGNFIPEAQMKSLYDIFEALDFKIMAAHDVAKSISKKLTLLIELLK